MNKKPKLKPCPKELLERLDSMYWLGEYGSCCVTHNENHDPDEDETFKIVYEDRWQNEWEVPIVFMNNEFYIDLRSNDCESRPLCPEHYWSYLFITTCCEYQRNNEKNKS